MSIPKYKYRAFAFLIAAIFMGGFITLGRVEPLSIDVDMLMKEYMEVIERTNAEEDLKKWAATKSDNELGLLPFAVGFDLIYQLGDDVITDSVKYNIYMSGIKLIENGMKVIEETGMNNALYLTTSEYGLIPFKYNLANAYDKGCRYVEADSAYIQTSREIGRDFGMDSEEFVFWTNQCAEGLQRKHKNYEKAIQLLLPAKEAALHSKEVSDSTACDFLISLAQKYQRAGNHVEAKALAIEAEKRSANNNKRIFKVCNTLGELYWTEGNHDISIEYFNKAERCAPSLNELFATKTNYANIMRESGFHEMAENALMDLDKYRTSEELTVEALFNYYESLGVLYTFYDPEKSAECFKKADEYINCVNYPELIRHIINSQVYPNEGNSFKIISALDRAEMIYNMLIGNEPRLLNELLMLKGYYLMDIHDYKTARKYLETAYFRMLDYANGDPQFLEILKYLAQLDEVEGDNIRGEFYLQEQLRQAKLHGETSNVYMNAVAGVLHFYLQINNAEQSEHFFGVYKKDRPDSFDTKCYEYRLKYIQGKYDQAEKLLGVLTDEFPAERHLVNLMRQRFYAAQHSPKILQVAHDVFANYKDELMRQLLFMSNSERRNMDAKLRSRRDEIISAVSFAPELTELAFDYSLFSKGLLFHTQNDITSIIADNDSARIEIAKINGLKADLTHAINFCNKDLAQSIQQKIDSRERYLIDDFLNREKFNHRFDQYACKRILTRIKNEQTMLDFVQYVDSGNTHIASFIIKQDTPVTFVEIGEVSGLNKGQISSKIWTMLAPYLKTGESIYFSTDGILNAMPIEFVEDQDGVPVCEKYDLHRVFHLADIRKDRGIGNRVEAIGVADHNSPNGQAHGLDDGYRGNWGDLAGVETELYRIAENLDGTCDYHRAFNDEATEAYVKSLSGQPITTLHISTHGFYRGENDLMKAYNDTTDFDHNIARRMLIGNRTSVSGLVMRNGNLSWKSEKITEDEDNILTSEEVETLSFPKLNLTVLSACDTGLGDVSSDGVWGLQRAFRIAGSGSLICSLHQVKDNGTADFMAEFYRQAANGLSIHNAFYNARKELLSRDPANNEIWSSFILIE